MLLSIYRLDRLCVFISLSWNSAGTAGVFWYLFWILVSYESPEAHPTITPEERKYIEDAIGESSDTTVPFSCFAA